MPRLININALKKESERLKTFSKFKWPCKNLNPKDLAKIGFYYYGRDDVVKCAFCSVDIGEWGEGDDPLKDHKTWSQKCKFINGEECGNISISEDEEVDEICNSLEHIPIGLEIHPFSVPERSNSSRIVQNLITEISEPKYPTLSTLESRIKTFETWPKSEILPPKKLAEAGFYFTNIHDNTYCFFCGGGLKNWLPSADPWVDHAAMFSKCGFVRSRKDEKFIQDAVTKRPPHLSYNNVSALLRSMGSSSTFVENIPFEHVKSRAQSEIKNIVEATGTSDNSNNSNANALPNSSCFSNPEEAIQCKVCYVNQRNILFEPCGHIVACKDCVTSLAECPICRVPYTFVIPVHL